MKESAKRWTTSCQAALGCAVAGALLLQTGCSTFGKSKQPGLLSSRDGKVPPAYTEPPPPPVPAPLPPPPAPIPAPAPEPAAPEPALADWADKGAVETVAIAPAKAAPAPAKTAIKQPPKVQSKISTYTVKSGDYLYKIAWLHRVSVDELAAFNKMKKTEVLKIGKVLQIPPGGHYDPKRPLPKPKVVVKKPEAPKPPPAAVAEAVAVLPATAETVAPAPADTAAGMVAPAMVGEAGQYTVQKNDNLWTIAKKFGVKSADIKAASKLTSNNLQIGQVLVIPGAKGTVAAATGPTPAAAVAPAVVPAVPDVAAPPSADTTAPLAGGTATAPTVAGFPNTLEHTVLEGETLESVAEMYEAKIEDILTANPQVKSNADLKPNITIVVPYK